MRKRFFPGVTLRTILLALSATVPLFAGAAVNAADPAPADGWVDLFNHKDLDGWEVHSGKAKFYAQDDCIVGETVAGTGNSFLCPVKSYGDFEMEMDFLDDPGLNSGVQIRSDLFAESRTIRANGKDVKLPADRLHGYQCEIDMDPTRNRWWTAGLYDEARRGWLDPAGPEKGDAGKAFTTQGRDLSKPGEWNHLRIACVGTSIKTWLNGQPRVDFNDAMTPSGRIGLQVHGVGNDAAKAGMKIKFKNIRLREIAVDPNTLTADEQKAGWQLLWDGKTSDGWRSAKSEDFPTRGWNIHDGVLTVHENSGEESAGGGDIITRKRYANFELITDFKTTEGCNSGIKIFVQPNIGPITKTGQKAAVGSAIGMEFQILDDLRHPDAKLGRDGDRTIGSLYDLMPAPKDKIVMPIGQWNRARIVSKGKHVEFWLNGQETVECERGSDAFREFVAKSKFKDIPEFGEWADGHILLQEHGSEVSFRNVKLRELKPE
jgi:hypothetical protein